MAPPNLDPRTASRLRAATVAVAVALTGVGTGLGLVLLAAGLVGALGAELGLLAAVVLAVVLSQAGFAAAGLGYVLATGRGLGYLRARVPTRRDVAWMVGSYVLAFLLVGVGAAVAATTGAPTASNQAAELGLERPEVLLWLVPVSLLVIGPAEELLFRGTVQARLRESFSPVVAVVAASALFAGLHVLALTGGLSGRAVSVALLFLPSLVLGAAYERTRNLVVTAVVHGAYDATLFGLLYAAVTYGPAPA